MDLRDRVRVPLTASGGTWRGWLALTLPYLLVVVLFFGGGLLIDGFTSWTSLRSILVLASFLGIASVGQTLTVMLGGIDLSIPALITLGDVLSIQLLGHGWAFGPTMVVILGCAVVAGLINALVSQGLGAHPLIVTLAMGSIISGAVLVTGSNVSVGSTPAWLTQAVSPGGKTFGIGVPAVVPIWLLIALAVVALQRRTSFGQRLYAAGSNPTAARFANFRIVSIWVGAYVLSAICAAVTGVLLAGFASGADPNIGDPYLFNTVAAVVIGGTSLLGGSGGYGRTVAGACAITILTTILLGKGFDQNVQQMVLGFAIIAVIGLYGRQQAVRDQI
jgi:ribose transport system permease protein